MDQNNDISYSDGIGYLIVKVVTGSGAIPLPGAIVTVRNTGAENGTGTGEVIATLYTDENGNTERIPLQAPSRSQSQTPGGQFPYSTYTIDVYMDRYVRNTYNDVPIFDGITAVQPVELIPLPENGSTDNYDPNNSIFYESPKPQL